MDFTNNNTYTKIFKINKPMKQFQDYHKEHPEIWKEFVKTTFEAIRKGFKNYSSKSIFEIIRWHRGGDIKSDSFKINNNYTADYAKMFMEKYPQHKGFFRTRNRIKETA